MNKHAYGVKGYLGLELKGYSLACLFLLYLHFLGLELKGYLITSSNQVCDLSCKSSSLSVTCIRNSFQKRSQKKSLQMVIDKISVLGKSL
jgi:hypothetical protein